MATLNIILAEDHNLVRGAIKMLLEDSPDIQVVGESANFDETLELLNIPETTMLLTEVNTGAIDGMDLISEAKIRRPDLKVLVLSMFDQLEMVQKAISRGASGYLLKASPVDELLFALKLVSAGGQYICTQLSMKLLKERKSFNTEADDDKHTFSSRELEVLQLLAEGMTSTQISEQLFLSRRTVEGHRQSLINKTNSKNTAQLIRYAALKGLLSRSDSE